MNQNVSWWEYPSIFWNFGPEDEETEEKPEDKVDPVDYPERSKTDRED